ncbi:chromo domain-containing [Fusarium longipes]|uniref:Chromo domain-containing n=1 Tax=Fusarium longipes TaxID=694270 RepID=A0A395T9F0_9HYPO|nr:chromo domain-containing [Fusarium longipes]
MKPPSCDPNAIVSIEGFHITPRNERVIFHCTDYNDCQVIISEYHLQRNRSQLVQGFWRKRGNLIPTEPGDDRNDRERVTGLKSYHILQIHDYRINEAGDHQLLVHWCGHAKRQATWEPYHHIWDCRHELVEEYFQEQGLAVPFDLPKEYDPTSDEEEARDESVQQAPRIIKEPRIKEENDD